MNEPIRLFMTADAVDGVWQQALDLARGLAAYDVETTLAVLGPEPEPAREAAAGAIPGLRLLETGLWPAKTADTHEALEELSIAVARFANVIGADIVHLHHPALAASARFEAPVVAVCSGCAATWWQAVRSTAMPVELLWRADLVRRGYRAASGLVAPTAAFAKMTARAYGLPLPPQVVHPGSGFAPKREQAYKARDFALVAGDLWDDAENIASLNRAAARLSVPVMAAGPAEGPRGERAELGYLWALGELAEADFVRWLGAAPVFVSTARYAPSSTNVIAAARAGAALVLSDIASFRELWHGAAVFVPADDDATIATAIDEALRDEAHRARLAEAARERSQAYSVKAMAAEMIEIYRAVLAGDSGLVSRLVAAE